MGYEIRKNKNEVMFLFHLEKITQSYKHKHDFWNMQKNIRSNILISEI